MPNYEYRCKKGHRYERREPFGSPREHECEKCGEPASRQLNAPAIAFKGSGWYKTDSRGNEPRTSKADKTKADSSKNSGSGESGTSSKSDSSSNGSSGDSSSKGEKAKISKAD